MSTLKLIFFVSFMCLSYLSGLNDGNKEGRDEILKYDPRCRQETMHTWEGK